MTKTESTFDRAVAIWIGQQYNQDPDKISNISFTTVRGGSCETCEYSYVAIEYKYGDKYKDHEMAYSDTPGEFVRQVAEIASGLE